MSEARRSIAPAVVPLTACALFAGAYYQRHLFSANQNTYFLKGLASSGYGNLSADWLANQADQVPVFTFVVSSIHAYASDLVFYLLFGLLTLVYAASLFSICARLYPVLLRMHGALVFFALLTIIHCAWLLSYLSKLIPSLSIAVEGLQEFARLATEGVAGQYILGPYLQPSAFGVLLIASIALFAWKREYLGIICATVAGSVHPTYILHAGVLTCVYLALFLYQRRYLCAIRAGALALSLIAPIVLYLALRFYPNSQSDLSAAQHILIDIRIPHHAKVSVWLTAKSWFSIAIAIIGVGLSYRFKRIFVVLCSTLAASILLTLLQSAMDSSLLALLFPWRFSTWLIPIASAITIGCISSALVGKWKRYPESQLAIRSKYWCMSLSGVFLVACCAIGVARTTFEARSAQYLADIEAFSLSSAAAGQVYLVPLEFGNFRLTTGVPIFVDWKSHPYRDVELKEWYRRISLAQRFYESNSRRHAIMALSAIRASSEVTRVVLKKGATYQLEALGTESLFEGDEYDVYPVR